MSSKNVFLCITLEVLFVSFARRFTKYVVPSVVSMLIFSLYTIVDGFFVARGVGPEALAAVNLSAPFTTFVFALGLLFAVGTSTVSSIALGQGDTKAANRYVSQNLVIMLGLSVVVTIITLFNLESVARFLGATDVTMEYTKQYMGTIAAFALFFIVSYNLEVLVKVDGSPHISAVGVASCALVNIVLDYVFVMKFGWGVRGAAIATGLAQVTSTFVMGAYLIFKSKKIRIGKFKWELSIYKRIIPNGLADGFGEMAGGIVIFLFNRTLLSVAGEDGVVSYTIVQYVSMLVMAIMSGIAQGSQPLISYHYGAQEQKTCHRVLRWGLTTAVGMGVFALVAVQLGAPLITRIFLDTTSELYAPTITAVRLYSLVFVTCGINVVMGGFFAAIERPRYSFTISLCRGLIVISLTMLAMASLFGITGIWLSPLVSDFICMGVTGLLALRYRKLIKGSFNVSSLRNLKLLRVERNSSIAELDLREAE